MTNTKHTPGPWHWVKCRTMQHLHGADNSHYFGISLSMPNRGSNMTWNTPEYRERLEANARLIAAAPELLAALEDLSAALDNEGNPSPFATLNEQARAAIAKAKGE